MKKIKLLKEDYKKNEQLFQAFVDGTILTDDTFFSGEVVEIPNAPAFPIYMGRGSEEEKRDGFLHAFNVISSAYKQLDHDLLFSEHFWHSLLVTEMRSYIITHYEEAISSEAKFKNIVLKKFDWENYIYKCVMAVDYIENATELVFSKENYYELIVDNLDIYNYIIKYTIFRNNSFLIKILTIIEQLNISTIMKAKIKNRPDLGADERYGRRVIFEMNKSYPVMMAPLMDVETLKQQCVQALRLYDVEVEYEPV